MAPKMPEEHADFRKKQIMMAAWECFLEKGYHPTTIRDISKAASLSTGAIYNYFKGKDEILASIHAWSLEQKETAFDQITRHENTRDALKELFSQLLECCPIEDFKKSSRGDISMWAEAVKRDNLRELFNAHHNFLLENIARLVKDGIKRGEFKTNFDPRSFASFLVALFIGIQVQIALVDGLDTSSYFKNLRKILLGNIWREAKDSSQD